MIHVVWEFIVRPDAIPQFQRAYGPDGDWAAFFRQHPGYEGTTLLQDAGRAQRFLTIDRWEHELAFERMRRGSEQDYSRLDGMFGELTLSERELGVFRFS
jgi:hypothetical protein